ncbi:MAG: signal recognition particle protein [Simkaniaceae bacterium]
MFGVVTEKFQNLMTQLMKKKLTEGNIQDAVRQVRLALLDADVNFSVVSAFIKRVKEKAVGEEILKSVDPSDAFIKLIHDELVALMGKEEAKINLRGDPCVILLCGLQGSGKTTTAAKLATFLKRKEFQKSPLLVGCDLQRAAAGLQLKSLGEAHSIPVYIDEKAKKPSSVAKEAFKLAKKEGYDVIILDSAGRLHIDEELMRELKELKEVSKPHETLFVASASIGQDAVKTAAEFDQQIGITGSVLTMLDGNARAGAALSILEVTKKPLKFEGVGEKNEDFQLFNPESMADRILGMGDVINLVKKAEEHFDDEEEDDLEVKLRKANFTYADYLKQMSMIKKLGPIKSLLKMLPGAQEMGDLDMNEKEFNRAEAIILSMTPNERICRDELVPSRRRRIAIGSGTSIDEVNRLVKGFKRVKQLFKGMSGNKKKLQKQLNLDSGVFDKFF